MAYSTLLTSLDQHILTITVNRPDKMNALNKTVLEELDLVMDEVYNSREIKAAIITGAGEKAFIAGADISEFTGLSATEGRALSIKGQALFFKIEQCPKPVVAAVNGFALGGGCELAMACHFRIVSEKARFGQPEVNLGIIPGYGGTQRLTQLVGKGRALELMMTGDFFSAADAKLWGWANEIVAQENLLPACQAVLEKILTKAPIAISQLIYSVNAFFDKDKNGYVAEVNAFEQCFTTKDKQEGTAAFLEKRKPVFKGE